MVTYAGMEKTVIKEEAYTHKSLETQGGVPHHRGALGEAPGSVRQQEGKAWATTAFIVVSMRKAKAGRPARFRIGGFE